MSHLQFVQTLLHLPEVGSTNDKAKALAVDGTLRLPVLIRADRQTKGRGRGANLWWSDPGSLTFSLLLDPTAHGLAVEDRPKLALATGVALVEAIEPWIDREDLGLRWPNDVELDGRKLAGILLEQVETPIGNRLIVGIGLNVRTEFDVAPPDVRLLAASIADQRERPLSVVEMEQIFEALVLSFAHWLDRLARSPVDVIERCNTLDLLKGRFVRVDVGSKIVQGIGRGIDQRGGLRLEVDRSVATLFGGQVLRE